MSKLSSDMPKYVPTKDHIKNALLLYFRMKKDISEARDDIAKAYGEKYRVPQSYCDYWYKRFENGDFALEEDDDTPSNFKNED